MIDIHNIRIAQDIMSFTRLLHWQLSPGAAYHEMFEIRSLLWAWKLGTWKICIDFPLILSSSWNLASNQIHVMALALALGNVNTDENP